MYFFLLLPIVLILAKMYVSICLAVKFNALTAPWTIIEFVEDVTFQVLFERLQAGVLMLLQYQIRFFYHI